MSLMMLSINARGMPGCDLADILLIIDIAVFEQFQDHDEVSCFFEELTVRDGTDSALLSDLGKALVDFLESISDLLALDEVVLFGCFFVLIEI